MEEKIICIVCAEENCTEDRCSQKIKAIETTIIDKSTEELIREIYG